MADQDQDRTKGQEPDRQTAQQDSVLGQQAGGKGGQANFDQDPSQAQGGFSGDVSGQGGQNSYGQGPEPSGTFQAGNMNQQGMGATSDQLGQNNQSYGQSTTQDTTFGQGPGSASLGAQGQTGVLGPRPGQGSGQPSSPTTGGPDLSQGLKDQNNQGGSGA